MQHDDQWDPDPLEHLEYLVAVRTTENAVLVLDHGHVEPVQAGRRQRRVTMTVGAHLVHHLSAGLRASPIDHAHHPDLRARPTSQQAVAQRSGEAGEAALCRRIGAQQTETGVPGGTTCVRPGRCASTCGRGTKCPPPVDSRMLRSAKPRHRSRGGAAVDGTGGRAWNPDGRGASGLLLRRRGRRRYGQRVQGRRTSGLNRGRAQCPVGGISAGLSACLAFFAARFSFRVLPGFFTLLFCGDLLDTTVLPHNIRMVRSDAGGTRRVHQPRPSQLRDPEQTWSDGHVISLTPIAPRPAGRRSARPVPPRRRRRAAPGVPARPEPLIVRLASMTVEQRATLPGVRRARARQILAGAIVAHTVMSSLDLARVERSARGLREGILLRRLSPLLTADSLYQIELIQAERKETYGSLAAVIVFPGLAVDLQHRGAPRRRVRRRDATRPRDPSRPRPRRRALPRPARHRSSRKTGTTTCDSQPASWKPRGEMPTGCSRWPIAATRPAAPDARDRTFESFGRPRTRYRRLPRGPAFARSLLRELHALVHLVGVPVAGALVDLLPTPVRRLLVGNPT